MTKPIFLVGIPQPENIEIIARIQETLEEKLEQYYPLVYTTSGSEMEFKCFFEKDFNEVKFEELKEIVRNAVK